jgi:diguanylate cyclase (GGDEF)-like protein
MKLKMLIPIRARILALAVITLASVGTALYLQYRGINEEVRAIEVRISSLALVKAAAQLNHSLQKERGLSGFYLANKRDETLKQMQDQRRETDAILSIMISGETGALLSQQWLTRFQDNLAVTRAGLDDGSVLWTEIRTFYTDAINHALDEINIDIVEGAQDTQGRVFTAVMSLAYARENLGLIRASVSRIYGKGYVGADDRHAIIKSYGAFDAYYREFVRDLAGRDKLSLFARGISSNFEAVLSQINTVIASQGVALRGYSAQNWWDSATDLIDAMKLSEDRLYAQIEDAMAQTRDAKKHDLYVYTAIAICLATLVILLTMFAIVRVLTAMRILLDALGFVVDNQDYKTRLPEGARTDEFGRINLSINDLLAYTEKLIEEKDYLANTDILTGASNRRSFLESAEMGFDRSRRYGDVLGLAVVDIDFFKAVNDTHGHDVGDKVLKKFATVLKNEIRLSDVLGRWGGEEFVVMAPQVTRESLMQLAEKLRKKIEKEAFPVVGSITCSIGISISVPEDTFETLFHRADEALYAAKHNGRNRVDLQTAA